MAVVRHWLAPREYHLRFHFRLQGLSRVERNAESGRQRPVGP